MTRFAKILTVLMTVISIAFLGVSLAVRVSGPNWDRDAQELNDYVIKGTPGRNDWSVQHRLEEQPIKTGLVQADAIAAAWDDARRRNTERLDAVSPRIPQLEALITQEAGAVDNDLLPQLRLDEAVAQESDEAQVKTLMHQHGWQGQDTYGMRARNLQLQATFQQSHDTVTAMALEADGRAQEALKQRGIGQARREDVFRLMRQLQEIETDHYQLRQQRRRLRDMLFQTRGLFQRLADREKQLINQGANNYDEDPPAENGAGTPAVPTPPSS